jgi:ankyrin repeat protein
LENATDKVLGHTDLVCQVLNRSMSDTLHVKMSDEQSRDLFIAIHTMSADDRLSRVSKLIRDGIDLNSTFARNGESPLQRTVTLDLYKTFMLFLQLGASPSTVNTRDGTTALHSIFMFREPNSKYLSKGKHAMLNVLLSTDIPVNKRDNDGSTALHLAVSNSSTEYVNKLLQHGADLHIVDGDFRDPLYIAIDRGAYSIISLLLQDGADINKCDEYNETKLHQFVAMGYTHDKILILLHYGIDYSIRNSTGHTAYDLALLLQEFNLAHFIHETIRQLKEDVPRLIG